MTEWSKKRAAEAALVLGLGGAFLILSHGFWHCPVRALTGIPCASCGVTTAFLRLLRLDVTGAWEANPLVFFLIPWSLWGALLYIRRGRRALRSGGLWAGLILALAAAGLWRLAGVFL